MSFIARFTPPRRVANYAVVAVLALPAMGALRGCGCAPVPPPPAAAPSANCVDQANAQRTANGLAPLAEHPAVAAAAQRHSDDQAAAGRMSHTGTDGSSAGDRLLAAGYQWGTWGENVAAGYADCAAVIAGWMNSPGHRANLLSPVMAHMAVAEARSADGTPYWTMVLAA